MRLDPLQIEQAIEASIERIVASLFQATVVPGKSECAVSSCRNSQYAKGLCNAHYIRVRQGKAVDGPIRRVKRLSACRECGETVGGKGGWGLCKPHYRATRRKVIRAAIIAVMGGRCSRCRGVFPPAVYDFHHRDPAEKDHDPSTMIDSRSVKTIADEAAKCELLCANCHRIEHHG